MPPPAPYTSVFPPRAFTGWNETDVRENILVPLYRILGYARGTDNDCITELYLRYPKKSLGRKKSRDPELVGKADYVFEVDKRLRWVMEAKGPDEDLTQDEREQAYTYATHPEVRALFFILSNGKYFEIHQTSVAPAVYCCAYENLAANIQTISNILSPASFKRDFPSYVLDTGIPLAPGLRSIAKIVTGKMVHREVSPILPGPNMIGLTSQITDGSVQRMPDGSIITFFKIVGAYDQLTEHAKSLGLEAIEMSTNDKALSCDPACPTKFTTEIAWGYPVGSTIPDISNNSSVVVNIDLHLKTLTEASGHFNGRKFVGRYRIRVKYFMHGNNTLTLAIGGDFEIELE
jgi:hypothetical protein